VTTIVGPVNAPLGQPSGIRSALNITAAGVLKASAGIIVHLSVVVPGSAGTFTLNDASSTGGATTANTIFSTAYNSASWYAGAVICVGLPCASGITVSSVPTGSQVVISFS
jgi:hypothetical protein